MSNGDEAKSVSGSSTTRIRNTGLRPLRLSGRRLACLLVAMVFGFSHCPTAWAENHPQESEVKAAFLLNFARLVTWPEETPVLSDSTFIIGVQGDPDLLKACRSGLQGRDIGGLSIEIREMSPGEAADPSPWTRIVFLSDMSEAELSRIIDSLSDRPILLVSDLPGFSDLGGSITMTRDGDRMAFEINRHLENSTGLKINSRLLRIARRVLE